MLVPVLAAVHVPRLTYHEARAFHAGYFVPRPASSVHVRLDGFVVQIETLHRVLQHRYQSPFEVQHPRRFVVLRAQFGDDAVLERKP